MKLNKHNIARSLIEFTSITTEQSKAIFQVIDQGIAITDQFGNYCYFNDYYANIFGQSQWELINKPWTDNYSQEQVAQMEQLLLTLDYLQPWKGEVVGIKRDGQPCPIQLTLVKTEDEQVLHIISDLTKQKWAEEAVRYHVYHDQLTGLANGNLLNERLNFAVRHAHRTEQKLAVITIDLDKFKRVNDLVGHQFGDEILQGIAARLQSCVTSDDIVSRVGSDKFVVLRIHVEQVATVVKFVQEIFATLSEPWSIEQDQFYITASMGVAIYPDDGREADILLKNSDIALHRAKNLGKNNYQLYTESMNDEAFKNLALEKEMWKALKEHQYTLYYQPQYELNTEQIVGAEALIRWNHPEFGIISPMTFIPLAESTGFIIPLGEWVLRSACNQLKQWHTLGRCISMSVNVSAFQFQHPNFIATVSQVLKETGIKPQLLELEITESAAMADIELTFSTMEQLKQMGVRISLDDFGTGYASLKYISSFPIDSLKIDRSFISDVLINQKNTAIVSTIITLAQNLGVTVIGEGVETQEQLAFLRNQNCAYFQGYLKSKPIPALQFLDLLEDKMC